MFELKGKLIKIESEHNLLRTDEVVGTFLDVPKVGERFTIYAEPLSNEANIRTVNTSPVKSIEKIYEKIWEMKTQFSTYHIEIE